MNHTKLVLVCFIILSLIGVVWFYTKPKTTLFTAVSPAAQTETSGLPPDPGEAGKQTLEGIDSNHDGVRDDVEIWIAQKYEGKNQLIKVLEIYAKSNQTIILNSNDRAKVISNANMRRQSSYCWDYLLPSDDGVALIEITAKMVNTPARMRAYGDGDKLLGGRIETIEFNNPDVCNF